LLIRAKDLFRWGTGAIMIGFSSQYHIVLSLGPHDAYFRMRTLKPQVAKAATVASVMRDK